MAYPARVRFQLVREASEPYPIVANPADLAAMLLKMVAEEHDDGREVFGVVLLDTRHRLIGVHVVSIGCLNASLVHAREVFAPALVAKAASIALWHTHPSCDPDPSAEDLSLTRRLAAGGQLLGIEVVDHLVLAADGTRYASLKNMGVL